jgi:DNA-binding transcriptional LysR family regulator
MQISNPDLTSLAVFRSVVEHRSFLGAQVALGLSQSAVSFHIKGLEQRLGFRLCRRGRSGFELTDRGAIVYEQSKLKTPSGACETGLPERYGWAWSTTP